MDFSWYLWWQSFEIYHWSWIYEHSSFEILKVCQRVYSINNLHTRVKHFIIFFYEIIFYSNTYILLYNVEQRRTQNNTQGYPPSLWKLRKCFSSDRSDRGYWFFWNVVYCRLFLRRGRFKNISNLIRNFAIMRPTKNHLKRILNIQNM